MEGLCTFIRTVCVSTPVWSTEHYSTYNYQCCMVMSLWNLSQGLHFGFSTISLTKVWIKRTYKETKPGFSPRCASLRLVYSVPQRWVCVFLTVSYCLRLFLWTPLLSLTNEATVILPVVLVWSVEDQAAVCTVGLCRGTSLKRVRVMQQASNWQKAYNFRNKKRNSVCKPHQITRRTQDVNSL